MEEINITPSAPASIASWTTSGVSRDKKMRALRLGDCLFAFSTSLIPYPLSRSSLVIKRSGLLSSCIWSASSSVVAPPTNDCRIGAARLTAVSVSLFLEQTKTLFFASIFLQASAAFCNAPSDGLTLTYFCLDIDCWWYLWAVLLPIMLFWLRGCVRFVFLCDSCLVCSYLSIVWVPRHWRCLERCAFCSQSILALLFNFVRCDGWLVNLISFSHGYGISFLALFDCCSSDQWWQNGWIHSECWKNNRTLVLLKTLLLARCDGYCSAACLSRDSLCLMVMPRPIVSFSFRWLTLWMFFVLVLVVLAWARVLVAEGPLLSFCLNIMCPFSPLLLASKLYWSVSPFFFCCESSHSQCLASWRVLPDRSHSSSSFIDESLLQWIFPGDKAFRMMRQEKQTKS